MQTSLQKVNNSVYTYTKTSTFVNNCVNRFTISYACLYYNMYTDLLYKFTKCMQIRNKFTGCLQNYTFITFKQESLSVRRILYTLKTCSLVT